MQTGAKKGFCCRKCEKQRGHGKRCLGIDINDEDWSSKLNSKKCRKQKKI